MDKENIVFEGILKKKEINNSTNKKAPKGFIYIDGLDIKITVWEKSNFEKLIENGIYKIIYNHKRNEFNGKIYDNYTLIEFVDKNLEVDTEKITFSTAYIENLNEKGIDTKNLKKGDGRVHWKLMDYPLVVNEDVREIEMPRKVIEYLINLKSLNEYSFYDEFKEE